MEWVFSKTSVAGYGVLYDSKGTKYNVEYDDNGKIEVTTTKRQSPVRIPQKVHKMILEKLGFGESEFKWVDQISAQSEAYKLYFNDGILIENACDAVLCNDIESRYAKNIESMTKKQFEEFVAETKKWYL